MTAIIKKEMRAYFTSVAGYGFLTVLLVLTGMFFSIANIMGLNPYYAYTLNQSTILFLILIPVLTMRLFAEESRQKTDQLLYTAPLTVAQIVVGKFVAAMLLFLTGMVITMIFPLIMAFYGRIPTAETIGAFTGFILLGACYIAVGIFISSLTENQIIAAVATFAVLFLFIILDGLAVSMPVSRSSSAIFLALVAAGLSFIMYRSTKSKLVAIILFVLLAAGGTTVYFINNLLFDGVITKVMNWFSLLNRFGNFMEGVLSISDIVYYVTFAFAFVFLTVNTIEKRRWA